jgi:hypothetical protein
MRLLALVLVNQEGSLFGSIAIEVKLLEPKIHFLSDIAN